MTKEGVFSVIPIQEDGTFYTSTSDMEYGEVNDKYFAVDKLGNRKPLAKECVHLVSTGGKEPGGYHIENLEITQSRCSEDFMLHGNQ